MRIKYDKNNSAMINLSCGTHMNWEWNNLDFSPYTRLARHMGTAQMLRRIGLLSEDRFQRLLGVDPEIIMWDLRKGIPFDDNVFDVVYSSHFLEHIDKDDVPSFLEDCHRVLKHNGIIRLVVPDLLAIINCYTYAVTIYNAGNTSHADYSQLSIAILTPLPG